MTETRVPVTEDNRQLFLRTLRASTDVLHKRLEATDLSTRLVQKDITHADYADYLMHMRNVIAFSEHQVFAVTKVLFPDIDARRKQQWIEQDLNVVGRKVQLPVTGGYSAGMDHDNLAFALGFMYVIEGSVLGGRILLDHIKQTLGYDEQHGGRFFAGYAADTGRMWKSFLETFSEYAVANGKEDEVIAGSKYAFTTIENYFA